MSHRMLATAMLISTALITACSSPAKPTSTVPSSEQPQPEPTVHTGVLAAPGGPGTAFSYNPAAPVGAELTVKVTNADTSTTVEFGAKGLQPSRGYAVHAHTKPCGATGADAGPHYQNTIDPAATPEKASVDPAYANPRNEFWLDVRTDAQGAGTSKTTVPFVFTDRAPASIIVHEKETTATHHGEAGTAGGRLACLTVPFEQ
ncbi:superoxide dismutase family protein [Allokutzneria oryzae]|uniref:Superoxide dismutase family protein n=1 Tax=Allokutzneria oryzae TaxID=1378989 RepID=A0ABV5ZW87_9PSEU